MKQKETNWDPKLYNEKHSFVYKYGEALIDLLQPKKSERILDLGCGSGQLTFEISKSVRQVVGIDKSPEMINEAKSSFPAIDFHVADATNFSFADPFDAIFSNAVLHWVTDYKKAVDCIYNNLKPGGRFVAEFGGKGNIQIIEKQLRKSLKTSGHEKNAQLHLWYFPSIGKYATTLENAGFRVVLAQHFDRPTRLSDKKTGIIDWLTMFGERFFHDMPNEKAREIKIEVQERLKSKCFKNGAWYADHKRIRVLAIKE